MKRIFDLLIFTLIIASLVLTACSSPTTTPARETQTPITQPTQAAPTTLLSTTTPVPTVAELPTSTSLPTEASTATQPPVATNTPTPAAALPNTPIPTSTLPNKPTAAASSGQTALINENTNCRSGPSVDYTLLHTFLSGSTATIVSRTNLPDYILVGVPNNTSQTCWLWTQSVTTSGYLSTLPIATAPPPLVNFTMEITRIEICDSYMLEFKVVNTGTKTLQAYTIVAKDLTAHTQQTTSSTTFNFINGCVIQQTIGYIDPGKVGYVYASNFTYDPKGNSFEATITICSHNDMTGACATQLVKFTP